MTETLPTQDLNIVHAAALVPVSDAGTARRGATQNDLEIIADGALAIRQGKIVAVGTTAEVLADWSDPTITTLDATGKTVLPGLVESHSHPLYGGSRHREYAERLSGATMAEVVARGGGIWTSVQTTRATSDAELLTGVKEALARMTKGGVTTVEVKSGYGLTIEHELHHLELLNSAAQDTPLRTVITFLGAHVVPRDLEVPEGVTPTDYYTDLVAGPMLDAVLAQGIADFQDVTVEVGDFTPQQALRVMHRSHQVGLPIRVHADCNNSSQGWQTAVAGGATSAEHLTYTPDQEITDTGPTDTVAVLLPVAELIYMTDKRANARLLINTEVPLAIATDYCSSIHATSLLSTMTMAAPWYQITPAEAIVACTLNAAYSLGRATECGSLDVGKAGDVLILNADHPEEIFMGLADEMLEKTIIGGATAWETNP